MAFFEKAPLDPEFEAALDMPTRFTRKIISKSQDFIRASLEPGEELRLIVPQDFTSERTFVVTTRRLLVFKNRMGSGVSENLEYIIRVTDRYRITVNEVGGGLYYVRLEGPGFMVGMDVRGYANANGIAKAMESMR